MVFRSATDDLQKAVVSSAMEKLVSDAVAPLQKALGEAQAQLKKLNDQPAPARISLRAVSKSDDVIPDPLAKVAAAAPVTDAVAPLQKALGEAQAQLKKLNDQPAPARIALRAVSKSDDVIPDPLADRKSVV